MATNPTSWWSKETVAVVTGGNKGIGAEIVRLLAKHGLTVVLTARDPTRGQATVDGLKEKGLNSVVFHTLDTRSSESAKNLAAWLRKEFGGIDILVNNAAIEISSTSVSVETNYEIAKDIVETNYRGVKNVTEVLLPLLRASPAGARIVNVTSRAGSYERLRSDSLKQKFKDERNYNEELLESLVRKFLEDKKEGRADEEGWVPGTKGYSESKMFLNLYAALLAKSLSKSQPEDHPIYVVSFCPGVTKTDMTAPALKRNEELPRGFSLKSPEEGADTGVWLALLPQEELVKKGGKLFGERKEYPFGRKNPPS